jgi:chemotaxis protein MotB
MLILLSGCRSGSSQAGTWPWQASQSSADLTGRNAPTSPSANASAPPPALARLGELFQREDEQTKLAAEQRRALRDLAEWQQSQQREIDALTQQRVDQHAQQFQDQSDVIQRQRMELEQLAELRRRALELDATNRELHTELAQAQQQNRLLEDQSQLLRQQLDDTSSQLARSVQQQQEGDRRLLLAQQDSDRRVSALQATLPKQGAATIRANNSLRRNLEAISITGLSVRQDGDVIRIELPSDNVFAPGTASLSNEALSWIDSVANAIRQHYPQQMIGIEAHTDNASQIGSGWQSRHQLTAAQAMAIFDQLIARHQFDDRQLFILGHGANYPLASNATPGGQQKNRRVEVVVYPEALGQTP